MSKLEQFRGFLLRVLLTLNFVFLATLASMAFLYPNEFKGAFEQTNHPQQQQQPVNVNDDDDFNGFMIIACSFWLAIMICSLIGVMLKLEEYMEPIMLIQIVYKSSFICYYCFNQHRAQVKQYKVFVIMFVPFVTMHAFYFALKLYVMHKRNQQMSPKLLKSN
jgi:hypothetical protein